MGKKVLLMSNTSFSIRKFRKELILSLKEKGYEVIISLPESDIELEKELGVKNVVIPYARRSKNVFKDIQLIVRFYTMFKQINPDIILSFTIKPNIYGSFASLFSHHKQICTITGTGQSFLKKNWLYYGVMILYRLAFSNHEIVIFQNENDREFFYQNKMIQGNSIVLSGSGVNLETFTIKSYPSANPLKFVFVGRIMHLKGFDLYIDAANTVSQKYDVQFYVVGEIEEKTYEEKLNRAIESGSIHYCGYQEDIRSILEECHCLVLPSLSGEGIPNSVLEANAMGRPCIVSNLYGCTEIIKHEVNGLIFKAGSFDDYLKQLIHFIELDQHKRIEMGINGRKIVQEQFSRSKVNEDYLRLMESELNV